LINAYHQKRYKLTDPEDDIESYEHIFDAPGAAAERLDRLHASNNYCNTETSPQQLLHVA